MTLDLSHEYSPLAEKAKISEKKEEKNQVAEVLKCTTYDVCSMQYAVCMYVVFSMSFPKFAESRTESRNTWQQSTTSLLVFRVLDDRQNPHH